MNDNARQFHVDPPEYLVKKCESMSIVREADAPSPFEERLNCKLQMSLMYDQKTFAGGVQARTVAGGTVRHPVVVTLDGVATELTLADATRLRDGLVAAVATVEEAEKVVLTGDAGHHFTIGKTMHGMSSVPSKLPA